MDNQPYDERENEDRLIFQDLQPEKPANALQKRIIHLQQHWPPHWNNHWSKRPLLILLTILSSLLICFFVFESIQPTAQQTGKINNTIDSLAIINMTPGENSTDTRVGQLLSYQNILYVIVTQQSSNIGTLEALSAQTGTLIWSYTHHNTQAINLFGDTLYIQTDTSLIALNATNHTQLWEISAHSDIAHGQIDQGILFTPTTNGFVTALNATTGQQLWQTKQPGGSWQADNGIFYTTSPTSLGVRALNTSNGHQLWYNTQSYQDLEIDNTLFYLKDNEKQRIEAFDGRNNTMLWQLDTHGKDFTLYAQDGFLALVDVEDSQVEVLNGQSGKLLWQHQGILNALLKNTNQTIISSLKKNETDILRTTDGTTIKHFPSSRSGAQISIENGIAFFTYNYYPQNDSTQNIGDNYIEAVRISDGATIWNSQTREEFPQLPDNTIGIVPTSGNSLLLVHANNGHILWQHTFKSLNN